MFARYLLFFLKALFDLPVTKSIVIFKKQNDVAADLQQLKNYRSKLLLDTTQLKTNMPGAGTRGKSHKSISDIAKRSSKPITQSIFLAKLASSIYAKNILELGTSFGLTSAAISMYNPTANIITIEGNQEIYQKSSDFFSSLKLCNIQSINGLFDIELTKIDSQIKFDLIFIDGNHTYDASLSYFEILKDRLSHSGIIVFDDIYWSAGMQKAWKEIRQHPSVKSSIDYFSFGLISLNQIQKPAHQKKISKMVFSH